MLETVLHKPTPPPDSDRWHIVLQGHPDELLDALEIVAHDQADVIQSAEWTATDELLICLCWIDDVIARLVLEDIETVSFDIKIIYNGRTACHGHNLST